MDGDLVGGDDVSRREIEEVDGSECSPENGVGENREISFDRLSSLPKPLLIHILSYLETRKAASTCVLSKRWKYLWTDLPALSFSDGKFSRNVEETFKLVIQVNRALSRRTVKYLDTLWIGLRYDTCFVNDINSWVEFAVKQKVKELTLHLEDCLCEDLLYVLPQSIYSCSSLTSLSVQRCIVELHGSINWKHLTELLIEEVELHEDLIKKILRGSPVLHTLRLERCWGFKRLHIASKSLYELSIDERGDETEGHLLEISAPYLYSLCVTNFPIMEKKLSIKNIPSLVRALIGFSDYCEGSDVVVDNVMKLFRILHHVKELETDRTWDRILCDMVVMGLQFPKSSRKSLILEVWGYDSLPGILALLESSPQLETLVLNCYEESNMDFGQVVKDDLNCDLTCLKTVRILGYADPYWGSEPMLRMARALPRALLRRATFLEKMVVEHWPDDAAEIVQTLRSYPKSSQNATITFQPILGESRATLINE